MIIKNGSIDVTQYFVLRDSTTHAPKTDVTITDIDLYYLEQGSVMAEKVDATALAAADSAHADNKAFHCGLGLYRIDWPDAAFDGGVGKRVFLIVVCTGVDTSYLEIELSPPANTTHVGGTEQTPGDLAATLGAPAGASIAADIATRSSQTSVDDIPTVSEFNARTIPAVDYFVVTDYTAPPSASTISSQVASDLAAAHGAGSWATATGFSTHNANDVLTALGTGSWITAAGLSATVGWGGSALPTTFGVSDKTGFKLASDGLALVTAWTVNITGTVSGNSTHTAANVLTALGTGSWITAIGDTRIANLDAAISTRQPTVANLANAVTAAALLNQLAPSLIGDVTDAGSGTEVFVYGGVTMTVTVDVDGNRTVAFT